MFRNKFCSWTDFLLLNAMSKLPLPAAVTSPQHAYKEQSIP